MAYVATYGLGADSPVLGPRKIPFNMTTGFVGAAPPKPVDGKCPEGWIYKARQEFPGTKTMPIPEQCVPVPIQKPPPGGSMPIWGTAPPGASNIVGEKKIVAKAGAGMGLLAVAALIAGFFAYRSWKRGA